MSETMGFVLAVKLEEAGPRHHDELQPCRQESTPLLGFCASHDHKKSPTCSRVGSLGIFSSQHQSHPRCL